MSESEWRQINGHLLDIPPTEDFPFRVRVSLWFIDDHGCGGGPVWGWDMVVNVLGVTTQASRTGIEEMVEARGEAEAFVPTLMDNALRAARAIHGDRFDHLMDEEYSPWREDCE